MKGKTNPVAKNMNAVSKPKVVRLKTLYNRKKKDWKKE
jgi:hypothetical protein